MDAAGKSGMLLSASKSGAASGQAVDGLDFMLFTNDPALASRASQAGIGRVVVDLERRGKHARQHGYHLEVNDHSVADIRRINTAASTEVFCRVNPIHDGSGAEIESVIAAGASGIILPMFHSQREVETFLEIVDGRARTILLFETREAVAVAAEIRGLAFDEVYVGLNDLSLSCGFSFCYEVLASGLVDQLRETFALAPFGFGGMTILSGGVPLSTKSILKEMARLQCGTVILRRAFKRDVETRSLEQEVALLRSYYATCLERPTGQIEEDHLRIRAQIREIVRAG